MPSPVWTLFTKQYQNGKWIKNKSSYFSSKKYAYGGLEIRSGNLMVTENHVDGSLKETKSTSFIKMIGKLIKSQKYSGRNVCHGYSWADHRFCCIDEENTFIYFPLFLKVFEISLNYMYIYNFKDR
uniref:Beta/gamma crystallin 'Greek key' domain-containing protein n=1 Tax=Heterorhabditis bacteriophora TaxID=37862 RepID=A0A1I7WKX5_HETBA